ncbi:hypothetical protein [Pseudomonas guariconensis]|uniref:hypothetical protein n=1 Tax=Pseudomonas guariconensis TaxID=1288410 RepID=UPI003905D328
MYKEQWERLVAEKALGLKQDEAALIVARAYGHRRLDLLTDSLVDPIDGLQIIKTPDEIRALPDRTLQMMEFLRMAMNMDPLQRTLDDIRCGHPQGTLIATMWGFPSFHALKAYASQDKIDPTSPDPEQLARFKARTGFIAPSQYLLGRDYKGHTLIIHDEPAQSSQWIDQEICLNNLDDLVVAVVRTQPDGDSYLNHYSRAHDVFRKPLTEDHSSHILGERRKNPTHRLAVSILPSRTYTLEQLVAAHYSALSEGNSRGSSLIIDQVPVARDDETIRAGLKLAASVGINVVLVTMRPDAQLWDHFESRVILGLDPAVRPVGHPRMDEAVGKAELFVGLKNYNLQLAYHSDSTGVVYGTVQRLPETKPEGATLLRRIFGKPNLG